MINEDCSNALALCGSSRTMGTNAAEGGKDLNPLS